MDATPFPDKTTIRARTTAIRKATPDCREKLFEQQKHICDLCGYDIQDLILAEQDHSIPVRRYAQCLDIALEDAIRECNHLDNLRIVHFSCNKRKHNKTRDEWFAQGLNKTIELPRIWTDAELAERRASLYERGRRHFVLHGNPATAEGRAKAGRIAVDSGQLASIQEAAAHAGGRRNAETGHMSAIGQKYGHIYGLRNKEKGIGIFAPDYDKSTGGRVGGKKTKDSEVGIHGLSSDERSKFSALGGRKSAPIINHVRWHVNRGIKSPSCALCANARQEMVA